MSHVGRNLTTPTPATAPTAIPAIAPVDNVLSLPPVSLSESRVDVFLGAEVVLLAKLEEDVVDIEVTLEDDAAVDEAMLVLLTAVAIDDMLDAADETGALLGTKTVKMVIGPCVATDDGTSLPRTRMK